MKSTIEKLIEELEKKLPEEYIKEAKTFKNILKEMYPGFKDYVNITNTMRNHAYYKSLQKQTRNYERDKK